MSSSEATSPRPTLRVKAQKGVRVIVADHSFAPLESATGELELDVDPGLYNVRYLMGKTVRQKTVVVPPGSGRIEVTQPKLNFDSPAPLSSTGASQSQMDAARELSHHPDVMLGSGGELFAFVTDSDRRGRRSPLAKVSLHDIDGNQLLDLGKQATSKLATADSGAWAGLTVALAPGPYRLRVDTGAVGRLEQTVVVVSGWQTQLFLRRRIYDSGIGGRTADIGDGLVLMGRLGRGFDAKRPGMRLADLARQGLSTGRQVVSQHDLDLMVRGKFETPMLGLYAAHLLNPDDPAERRIWKVVVGNLHRLLPGHPDVQALELRNAPSPTGDFSVPPMLRASWGLVVDASARHPELVPTGSLAARVAGSVYSSSTWLTWRVVRERRTRVLKWPTQLAAHQVLDRIVDALPADPILPEAGLSPVEQDVLQLASTLLRPGSIPNASAEGNTQLVQELGVPLCVAEDSLISVADHLDLSLD
jgi:hypothetical protein